MKSSEKEFRTEQKNILLFKIQADSKEGVLIDAKNGKKEELLSLDTFVKIMNSAISDSNVQLRIVSR